MAAWQLKRCWCMSWSASSATSCRCTANPEMLKRQGITIDRSTLSDWVGRTCWWLRPLYDLTLSTVLSAPVVFADDTTLPVLDPGRGKTKTGRLWCWPRSIRGPGKARGIRLTPPTSTAQTARASIPPNISPASAASCRSMATPEFPALAKRGTIELVFCWAHCRRHFYDFHAATKSPLAAESTRPDRQALCDRGRDPRPAARAPPCRPPAAQPSDRRGTSLQTWLKATLVRVSNSSPLADAIRYTLRHWSGLGTVPR